MARRTEDHPLEYTSFEGVIPTGEYGAAGVIVADHGTYTNATKFEMTKGRKRGHLSFRLHGEKLRGGYAQPESALSGRTLDEPDESS